jgi:hypothetical protein
MQGGGQAAATTKGKARGQAGTCKLVPSGCAAGVAVSLKQVRLAAIPRTVEHGPAVGRARWSRGRARRCLARLLRARWLRLSRREGGLGVGL